MNLPRANLRNRTKVYQTAFGGLCREPAVPEGCMSGMEGVSPRGYPAAGTREKWRLGPRFTSHCNGLYAKEKLLWVDGTMLFYDGAAQSTLLSDCEKRIAGMGSGVYLFPDKVRFDIGTYAVTELENRTCASNVTVCMCEADGTALSGYTASVSAPEDPVNGQLWLDLSEGDGVMKQWSESRQSWTEIETAYVRLSASGLGSGFAKGDCVTVAGFGRDAFNGWREIFACGDDFVTVTGVTSAAFTETGPVSIARTAPDLDFVCEMNNRLWGCNSEKHEIYCSALGDGTNWNAFRGLSTDSYAVTDGSDGAFTGCAAFMGSVLFFKRDAIIRVYGTKPANFQLSALKARGIEPGSALSAATVNEVLFYHSPEGIMRYDAGGLPQSAGLALGHEWYTAASGCAAPDGRYFLMWMREDGSREVLSFDPVSGQWYREKGADVRFPVRLGRGVYGVLHTASGDRLAELTGTEAQWTQEDDRACYFVTGDLGLNTPDKKRVSRLKLRAAMGAGAALRLQTMYDSDGVWRDAAVLNGAAQKRTFEIPILPRRCDHMRLKAEWTGEVTVYSLSRTVEAEET